MGRNIQNKFRCDDGRWIQVFVIIFLVISIEGKDMIDSTHPQCIYGLHAWKGELIPGVQCTKHVRVYVSAQERVWFGPCRITYTYNKHI